MKKRYYVLTIAGCFLLMFYGVGLSLNMFSMFVTPMLKEYGYTQTQVSNLLTLQSLVGIISIAVTGNIYNRLSTRKAIILYSTLSALAYLLFAFGGDGIAICYIAAICLGAGSGGCGVVPASIVITNWFVKDRGTALGACLLGSGFASLLWSPIIAEILVRFNLEQALLFHGGTIFTLALIVTVIVRAKPSERGLKPFGTHGADETQQRNTVGVQTLRKGYVLGDAMRTKEYALLTVVMFFVGMIISPMNSYFPSFIQSMGYDTLFVGTAVSIFGAAMILGKLLTGRMLDMLPKRVVNVILFVTLASAMLTALIVSDNKFTVILFVIVYGLSNPVATVPLPIWTTDIFGTLDYNQIYSKILLGYATGSVVGYQIIGRVLEATGNYLYIFGFYSIISFAALFMMQIVYKSNHSRDLCY